MKKSLFFAALFAVAAFLPTVSLHAQRFEWAKGYSSHNNVNEIKGSVTDDEGNLYILGEVAGDATWEGDSVVPSEIGNRKGVIIAKISPDGDMLWHKVVFSSIMTCFPQDIKKVGDSAFACMMMMPLPYDNHYTYYLDTLIFGESDYPVPGRYMAYPHCNAFVVFDFDGNVKEQHFLHITYTDSNGVDICTSATPPTDSTPWYNNSYFQFDNQVSFDIDGEGNIFISRKAYDAVGSGENHYDVQEGTLQGIKFWVDRRLAGYYPIKGYRPMKWYPQIVKFSPHFDTMLACRYVIQTQSDSMEYVLSNTTLKVDNNGNVYHMCEIANDGLHQGDSMVYGYHSNTLYILYRGDTTRGISFYHCERCPDRSFLVQFDNNLEPNWVVTLDDSIINEDFSTSRLWFHDLSFDYDSNLFFISATTGRGPGSDTSNYYSILTYDGTPLDLKNDAFVMAFRMDTANPTLHSYGRIPAIMYSHCGSNFNSGNLVAKNNKIFLQHVFVGGVGYPNDTIIFKSWYDKGVGLAIFDYSGRLLLGIPYHTVTNHLSSISLQDSVLYLTQMLTGTAKFVNIQVPEQGYNACVAKYIDTAFMSPYLNPGDTGNVSIVMSGDNDAFVVYPNPFRHRVTVRYDGGEELTAAYVTSLDGRSEQVRLQREGAGRYTIDLTARPQSTCLLTLFTASGRMHTLRLLKQSDMFGDQ